MYRPLIRNANIVVDDGNRSNKYTAEVYDLLAENERILDMINTGSQ